MASESIWIQHRFTIEKNAREFSDAIVLLMDEYNSLTKDQIEAIKADKFDTWLEIVTNPITPTETQLEKLIEQVNAQIDDLVAYKSSLEKGVK